MQSLYIKGKLRQPQKIWSLMVKNENPFEWWKSFILWPRSMYECQKLPLLSRNGHLRSFENRSGVRNSFGAINSDSKPDAPPCKAATIQFFRAENRMTLFCVNHSQTANLAKILQSRLNAQSETADSTCFTSISNFPFASSSALPAVNNSLGTYR